MSDSNAKLSDKLKHLNRATESGEQAGGNRASLLLIARVVLSGLLCFAVPALSLESPVSVILLICAGLVCGADLIVDGVVRVTREEYFNRNVIVTLIFVVSFIVGVGYEGALLMILIRVGELLSGYVDRRVRESVTDLTGLAFETANVVRRGQITETWLDEVQAGDEIAVAPGEYFPLDCIVLDGTSTVDTSLITGKARPVPVTAGDTVLAGSANLTGAVRCEVISEGTSTASEILKRLNAPQPERQHPVERLFTPALILVSFVFALVLAVSGRTDAYEAVHRALALFTLSSALPAFSGVKNIRYAARAGAASRGAVFSGDEALLRTEQCGTVIFSAEGTLTAGYQKVVGLQSNRMDSQTLLKIAAHAVAYSRDPSANAIIQAYGGPIYIELVQDFVEIPNCGVKVTFDGVPVVLGTAALMAAAGNPMPLQEDADNAVLFLTIGREIAGTITLADPIRKSCTTIRSALEQQGVTQTAFSTSYGNTTAEQISQKSGITTYRANCGDDGKLQFIADAKPDAVGNLLYLCDRKRYSGGHSAAELDAVLGCSPVDAGVTADIYLPGEKASALCSALSAAHGARRMCNVSEGILFAVKAVLIALAAFGVTTVWFSAFVETAVSLIIRAFSVQAFFERPFAGMAKTLKQTHTS